MSTGEKSSEVMTSSQGRVLSSVKLYSRSNYCFFGLQQVQYTRCFVFLNILVFTSNLQVTYDLMAALSILLKEPKATGSCAAVSLLIASVHKRVNERERERLQTGYASN